MISSAAERDFARQELADLESWLARLTSEPLKPRKELTIASVRKMIARVQEELAQFEKEGSPSNANDGSDLEGGDVPGN